LLSAANGLGAGAEGHWIFHKDNSDDFQRAFCIQGSSFRSLIATLDGVAYENGWWTENPGTGDRIPVVVRYGDDGQPDNIEYRLNDANNGEIWLQGEPARWGTMTRSNCDLTLQYRNWSDTPHEGCAWLHIKGWGYSGLDGDCIYNEEWKDIDTTGEMECLIEAPAALVN
jgi:hypothetical protein